MTNARHDGDAGPLVRLAPSLAGCEKALLRAAGLPEPAIPVCDPRTLQALGARVAAKLRVEPVVLEAPAAEVALAETLAFRCQGAGSILAIGSGTLNDLVKFAASRLGVPCAVFATAPSQNGWLTATASLAVRHVKTSLPVVAPRAAFFDLAVLAAAPPRLRAAGIGDALCRPVVEADLRLAQRLVGASFDPDWFEPLRASERALGDRAAAAVAGESQAVRLLTEVLVEQSLVMRAAATSAPASQGEHAIAHLVECFAEPPIGTLHGELVALGTAALAAVQHRLLTRSRAPTLHPLSPGDPAIGEVFADHAEQARAAIAALGLDDPGHVAALEKRLRAHWTELRCQLLPLVREARERVETFQSLGLPVRPQQLGLDPGRFDRLSRFAFALRPRFGFLTLTALAGETDS